MGDLNDVFPCPSCGGSGLVEHPLFGARSCPDPEVTCPWCKGECEMTRFNAQQWFRETWGTGWGERFSEWVKEYEAYVDECRAQDLEEAA